MTETQLPAPAPKKRRLFEALRTDPKKVSEGVWLPAMENGDQLRARKQWCPEHCRAYIQARADYEAKHGKGSADKPEAQLEIEAVGMASGLITDWKIADDPERAYDAPAMAGALADPELRELRTWISVHTDMRAHFRPDHVAGN
jgi:hypothetical protein